MKTIISIFFILIIASQINFLNSQYQLGEKWVARYNGYTIDWAYDIAVDGNGNVYVTGPSMGLGGNYDYLTVKYNSSGIQQWAQRWNGGANVSDVSYAIAVDATGNVYVTGHGSFGNTNEDCVTIKYNSSGVQQWTADYDYPGSNTDCGSDIVVDSYGNVYVCGYCNNQHSALTLMYNSSGAQQWAKVYGTILTSGARALAYINGYVIVSGFASLANGTKYYLTIEYSGSGTETWVRTYEGPVSGDDVVNSIGFDGSGNIYVTGYSYGGATSYDYATVKYNSAGAQQWVNRFNYLSWDDFAYEMKVDNSGNSYITGLGKINSTQGNIVTIKLNNAGVYQWGHAYNGAANDDDCGYSIALDNNGSVYVAGKSVGSGTDYDCVLLRYSTSGGNPLVEKRYNGPGNSYDVTYKCAVDANGCVYTTGGSIASSTGEDFCTIKYVPLPVAPVLISPASNTTGISCTPLLNWNDVVNADNYSVQVSTSSTFNTFVVNQSGLTSSQYQVPTNTLQNNVLYYWRACAVNTAGTGPWSTVWNFRTALVGIQPISSEIPSEYKLYSNQPNPFNPNTVIRFDIPASGYVSLKVFDVSGEEVETLINEKMNPGKYQVSFDGSSFPSGVYFYQLLTDNYSGTKKMILVK